MLGAGAILLSEKNSQEKPIKNEFILPKWDHRDSDHCAHLQVVK